jgi:hypothetical protein
MSQCAPKLVDAMERHGRRDLDPVDSGALPKGIIVITFVQDAAAGRR